MPISKSWSPFIKEKIKLEKNELGIYELGDENGFVVYIGQSNNIRERLLSHFSDGILPISRIKYYRVEWTPMMEYENQRENALIDYFTRVSFVLDKLKYIISAFSWLIIFLIFYQYVFLQSQEASNAFLYSIFISTIFGYLIGFPGYKWLLEKLFSWKK